MRSQERVFILWGMADEPTWPGLEALGGQLVAGHQADAWWPGWPGRTPACTSADTTSRSSERGYTWPTLVSVASKPRCGGHRRLEPRRPASADAEQVEHVLLGADRALDAAQRVAGEQVLDPARAPAAAPRRRWRSACRAWWPGRRTLWLRPVITRLACSAARSASRASAATMRSRTSTRAGADLQLLDVLGEVARGHARVDVLVAGQRRELLDAGLHVVAGDPLAGVDRLRGRPGRRPPRRPRSTPSGTSTPEVALGPQHGDPELPLEHDLVLGRPDARPSAALA